MPSLNPAIPGLDVSEVSLDSLTQPFKRQTKPLPVPDVREIFPSGNRSAIPGLEVHDPNDLGRLRNFEQIDPKTLRPRMAGSPAMPSAAVPPTAPTAAAKPVAPSGGWLRRTAEGVKDLATDQSLRTPAGAGRAAGSAVRQISGVAKTALPAAVGMEVGAHLGDYRINDPDVDSSVSGTLRSLRDGNFQAAGRSLSKGAVEAAMGLGSGVANVLDYVVPGKAPVSTALDRKLRTDLGDMLIGPRDLPAEPTAAGVSAPLRQAFTPSTAGGGRGSINPALANPNDRVRDDPRAAGIHTDMTGALAPVSRDLPSGLNDGRVYKTRDAAGNVTYSGRNVEEGAKIADGRGALVGQLDSGNAPGPVASGSMYDRELTSLRDLGAASAAANPGWGGGATGMGPSLRDIERKNAETTASSIDRRTAARGERQIDSMDKQDITNTQAGAQRYGADAGLRGSMYAADRRLQGDLAQSQANTLRTQMEMQFKTGNRALMAQIYQRAGGDLATAKKLALASGLDPQVFEQALAGDQAAEAKNQSIQGTAVDRAREDLKAYVPGKDGGPAVEDKAASQAKLDAMRRLFPGITGTDPAYYEANAPKIKALADIYDRVRAMPKMGLDKLNPFGENPVALAEMPDWHGATLKRASGLQGPLTPGVENGDYYITTKDGRDIPLGQLDQMQAGLIRTHTKTGKWN